MLGREPEPLGDALGQALSADGIELHFGQHAASASRDGEDYLLTLQDGTELRGDRLLVATGRRPRDREPWASRRGSTARSRWTAA